MSKSIKKNFPVTGMGCASCVARVQKAISEVKGVSSCNVSLASNSAQVEFDPGVTNPEQLSKAVSDAGYGLIVGDEEGAEEEADRLQEDYYKSLKRDMLLAAILALLVMLLGMGFGDMPW
ncbi:MAG: heavy-metal-associated domain-containing protein, partial [Bacteroidales bacterium]|nr:heavy-metal-associated domain-containing protein [Bacteroidales bacterium]